ncbi:MAG: GTP-binding protein [Candidatus Lokiarchaeota archaeon]|nr:GTP-binding protein [Candidatus Lokiarchaeota archaeon]
MGKITEKSIRSFIYKVVVVGDGGVGKTSMVLRYCENSFKENYIMTIGSNFSTKSVELEEYPNFLVKLQLWDLAGQKHFSFVRPPFYRGATAVVFVFDLTRRSSFQNILEWKSEVEKVIGDGKPSMLVGNKIDLADRREVGEQEGNALKDEINALGYYEASAKQDLGVHPVFKDITLAILKNTQKI